VVAAFHEEEDMGVFREAMRRALALRGLAPRTCSAYPGWLRRAFLLDLTQRQLSFLEPSESSTTKHETRQDTYRRLTGNDPHQLPRLSQRPSRSDRRDPAGLRVDDERITLQGAMTVSSQTLCSAASIRPLRT
jgi:hypothetical protein